MLSHFHCKNVTANQNIEVTDTKRNHPKLFNERCLIIYVKVQMLESLEPWSRLCIALLLNRLNLSKTYICPTPTSPNPGSSTAAVKIIHKQATVLLIGLGDTRNYAWWLGCKDIRVYLDRDQNNQMCVSVCKAINKHKSPSSIDINNKQQLMQDFPGNSK